MNDGQSGHESKVQADAQVQQEIMFQTLRREEIKTALISAIVALAALIFSPIGLVFHLPMLAIAAAVAIGIVAVIVAVPPILTIVRLGG